MRIAIVGAGGDVGRTLALHLVSLRVLAPGDQLQLIGHGTEHTERRLLAVRVAWDPWRPISLREVKPT